jgi:cytochrome c biogenesis protein CcmG/thiol:disulfide interchange protein DsbE
MNVAVPTRTALRGAGGMVRRHKVISSAIAVFVAAAITVSLVTRSSAADGSAAAGAASQTAAGFALPELGGPAGAKVSLAQYAGKPVIVNFWASWCDPCKRETPLLARWYKAQHGKVALLGLDENDHVTPALTFAHANGVSYPLGFDPNVTVASAYGIDGLPQTFFLNARHQIVDHVFGPVTTADLARGLKLMNAAR